MEKRKKNTLSLILLVILLISPFWVSILLLANAPENGIITLLKTWTQILIAIVYSATIAELWIESIIFMVYSEKEKKKVPIILSLGGRIGIFLLIFFSLIFCYSH